MNIHYWIKSGVIFVAFLEKRKEIWSIPMKQSFVPKEHFIYHWMDQSSTKTLAKSSITQRLGTVTVTRLVLLTNLRVQPSNFSQQLWKDRTNIQKCVYKHPCRDTNQQPYRAERSWKTQNYNISKHREHLLSALFLQRKSQALQQLSRARQKKVHKGVFFSG